MARATAGYAGFGRSLAVPFTTPLETVVGRFGSTLTTGGGSGGFTVSDVVSTTAEPVPTPLLAGPGRLIPSVSGPDGFRLNVPSGMVRRLSGLIDYFDQFSSGRKLTRLLLISLFRLLPWRFGFRCIGCHGRKKLGDFEVISAKVDILCVEAEYDSAQEQDPNDNGRHHEEFAAGLKIGFGRIRFDQFVKHFNSSFSKAGANRHTVRHPLEEFVPLILLVHSCMASEPSHVLLFRVFRGFFFREIKIEPRNTRSKR
jgi:hypothetical protein